MKPKILDKKTVAKSRLFEIEQLHLKFSNDNERIFERIKGPYRGSVMIVPLLDENTILLAREYGAGIDDYYLGFPKGMVEADESMSVTANRELKEEVGYGANKITHLAKLSGAPGYVAADMTIFVASDLYPQQLTGDEPEPIEVVSWKLDNVEALLANKEFHESRSVAALFLLLRQLSAK